MNYKVFAEEIIAMRNEDLKFRAILVDRGLLGKGYNKEMERLHNKNADRLYQIINVIGFPTIDKVGEEAHEAAWLIVQHAIAKPAFMKKCVSLLDNISDKRQLNQRNVAYLKDRIAVLEGKPQLFGTQFDWDENGEMSPNAYDDLTRVNERRKSIGLNALEEQISKIRKRTESENHLPPPDLKKRQIEMEKWKKEVGWKD